MNILLVGFGTAGKYYYDILRKLNFIKNIYVHDPKIKNKPKTIKFINIKKLDIKKKKLIMQ